MKRFLLLMITLVAAAVPLLASAQGYDPYRPGYDDRYDGRRAAVIRCESQDHRTRMCRVDTRGGVRIVRQMSDAPCVRGRTWGTDRNGIWVTRGCRAQFEIGGSYAGRDYGRDNWRYDDNYDDRYYGGRYNAGYGSGAQVFRCESVNERQRVCRLPYQARGVQIRRQLSRTRCEEGYNWGYRGGSVWVDGGCRAEFVAY
jgi:hypothetical protein